MLPKSLLSYRPRGGVVVPDYLGPHDYPWLRALIDEYARFAGRQARELTCRLREPLSPEGPGVKKKQAAKTLDRLCKAGEKPAMKPVDVRTALFAHSAAAAPGVGSDQVFLEVARKLEVEVAILEECMFADLPPERRTAPPPAAINPVTLALETNLDLAQGLVRRAVEVKLELSGNARSVVRLARLKGLICVVERPPRQSAADAIISASGPLALFRRTLVYGRALAALVPGLAWCQRFRLEATCLLDRRGWEVGSSPGVGGAKLDDDLVAIEVRSGDPIFPAAEPSRFDSRLEERFAREFARAALDWEIVREPQPIETSKGFIFPDFALEHRRNRERRWLLEIVGYWTEEYIRNKLTSLREARVDNLIVCIDADRNCGSDQLPPNASVIHFRRRVDPAEVLRIVEAD